MQAIEMTVGQDRDSKPFRADHPIELLARAYGVEK